MRSMASSSSSTHAPPLPSSQSDSKIDPSSSISPPSFPNKGSSAFPPMLRSPQQSSAPPSGLQLPALVRSSSSGRPHFSGGDWRINVAIEERTAVREKITAAYKKNCPSYEDLLQLCVAVDEELIFSGCNSRMEYFKNAVQWNNRLLVKSKQLNGKVKLGGSSNGSSSAKRPLSSTSTAQLQKRAK